MERGSSSDAGDGGELEQIYLLGEWHGEGWGEGGRRGEERGEEKRRTKGSSSRAGQPVARGRGGLKLNLKEEDRQPAAAGQVDRALSAAACRKERRRGTD